VIGGLVGSDLGELVGASPASTSVAGRLVGDSLFGVVGVPAGLLKGLVVGLSSGLAPGAKVGSEESCSFDSLTGLVVGLSTGLTPGARVGSLGKRSNKGLIVGTNRRVQKI
jgi:hypothetical protein